MTHVQRPNRRRIQELEALASGGTCPRSGKVRYLSAHVAEHARTLLVKHDPDPARAARLEVFWCGSCRDWHVGHAPAVSDG